MCAGNDQRVPEYQWVRRVRRARFGWIVAAFLVCLYFLGIGILLSLLPESLWYIAAVVPFAVAGWIGLTKIVWAIYGACGLRCPYCEVVITPEGRARRGHWHLRLGAHDINCPRCRQPVIDVDYRPIDVVTRTISQEDMIELDEWSEKCRRAFWGGCIDFVLLMVLLLGVPKVFKWVPESRSLYGLLALPAVLGLILLSVFFLRCIYQASSVICPACGVKIGPDGYGLGQKDKGYVRLSRSSRRCPRCRTVILTTEEEGEQ